MTGPVAAWGEDSGKELNFKGQMLGRESRVVQGAILAVDGWATGVATHLGEISIKWKVTVNLADGSGQGTARYTTANGDQLETTIVGQGTPLTVPGLIKIVEINTVVKGTGRFANARGSFVMERLVNFSSAWTGGVFKGL